MRRVVTAVVSIALLTTGAVGVARADETVPTPGPTAPAPVAPVVSVTASAPSKGYLGEAVKISGKLSGFTGTVTVQSQVWVKDKWVNDSKATATGSSYTVSLKYGKTVGRYKWRVLASAPATETTLAAETKSKKYWITRVAQTATLKADKIKRVGKKLTATGTLEGFSGKVTVKAQVYVDGKWKTSKTIKVNKGAKTYKVELPYNLNKVGTRTWRVVATSGSQKATSGKVKVQRVPLREVTGKGDRTKKVSTANYAKGKITGFDGTVKVKAQVYTKGKWRTKETKKIKVKYSGTSYTIELPYAIDTRGTTKWRVLVDDGEATRKATSFKVTRVYGDIDSRCLTGRVLCISKGDRKLRWMVDGVIKKTMDARFGNVVKTPTRNGAYKVYWKSRDHVSSLYGSPMPFAMFFSGGQAVHYSSDFARRGYAGASHGCVNIRDYAGIKKLFDTVRVGDKVIVYA